MQHLLNSRTTLIAQTKRIRRGAAYVILAAIDHIILMMMMLEMSAQMLAEQL